MRSESSKNLLAAVILQKQLRRWQHLHHVVVIVPVNNINRGQDLLPDGGRRQGQRLGLEEVGHEENLEA